MSSIKSVAFYCAIAGGFILAAVNPLLAQRQPACKTWTQLKSEIRELYSDFGSPPIPDIPNGFKNGCVFGDSGANTIAIFVLKDGLRPRSVRNNATLLNSSIPLKTSVDLGSATVENGRVLQFNNVCASTGTISFCQNTPSDRAYAKNGFVCFRYLCMKAVGVPNRELLQLWNATRNQWPQP